MTDPDTLLHQALALHQAGECAVACDLYRQVLEVRPTDHDALHLLGVARITSGETADGIALIQQAIAISPIFPSAHFNLGGSLLAQRQAEPALASLLTCIEQAPNHAGALAAAGRASQTLGRSQEAVEYFVRALRIVREPASWSDLGNALFGCNRLDEALQAYDEALRLRPDYAEAHCNRGYLLLVRQRYDEAAAALEAALAFQPDHRSALLNLAITRQAQARAEDALSALDRLLALEPSHAAARKQRGALLTASGRNADAVTDFTTVLEGQPDDADALAERGGAFWMLDRPDAATCDLDRALALDPDHATALVNRANVLQDESRYDAALAFYDQALVRRPDNVAALTNRGAALLAVRRHAEALDAYRRALAIRPDDAATLFSIGLCLLHTGAWREGWQAHEARLHQSPWLEALPTFGAALWDGRSNITGKRLLLVGEQGLGDTIQFSRFARLVAARGATVILGVEPPLRRLMRSLSGVAEVVAPGEPEPPYDLFCPLMSLPAKLGMGGPERALPYLRADPDAAAEWQSRLASWPGLKVGLVWAGASRAHDRMALRMDRRRSVALERLAPLLAVPGVTFVSLQKGEAADQAAGLPIVDWTAELNDFADTAALIEALDLVISVDTSVAHAAGALGQRVWVLNRFDRCWRWMSDSTDTAWYPTMQLFTQTTPAVWDDVVADITAALDQLANGTLQAS